MKASKSCKTSAAVMAAVIVAVLAAGAYAQDSATVAFKIVKASDTTVDVGGAKITAKQGSITIEKTAAANGRDTLKLPLGGTDAVQWHGGTGQSKTPVITASRGNINLRLPAQSYQNAEIALYSVNGKRVLRGKADATNAANAITRRNVAAGVYTLSVKGTDGNPSTTRLTHNGGDMNINVAFGDVNAEPSRKLAKSAAEGPWNITVAATGYKDSAYTLNVTSGTAVPRQVIKLVDTTTGGGGNCPAPVPGPTPAPAEPPTPTDCFSSSKRSWDDVKYGTRTNNVVDIKVPSSGEGPWPLIIFVHGGAWQGQAGSENSVTAPFNNAPSKGYALASVRYSYIGSGKAFPESVEDVLAAIRFLRANAACYKINPDKIGITGFSSGGYFTHIAAALSGVSDHGFDNPSLGNGTVSSKVQAAASCSGLSDFLLLNEHAGGGGMMNHCGTSSPNGSYFGFDPCNKNATCAQKDIVNSSNPILHIQAGSCADLPPVLSMHGTADNIVPYQQSKLMADELNKKCPGKGTYYEHSGGHNCPSGYDNQIWQFLDAALK